MKMISDMGVTSVCGLFADAGDGLLRADFDAGIALGALGVVDREVVGRVDRADRAGLHAELALDALGRVDGDVDERGAGERFAALKSALSAKAAELNVVVIDSIKMEAPKTAEFAKFLKAVGCDTKTLVVTAAADANVVKSGRNIPGCEVTFANLLNVYDVVNATKLVVDKAALAKIEEVFA